MEEIFDRFPHIGNQILQNLNDQSLQECRLENLHHGGAKASDQEDEVENQSAPLPIVVHYIALLFRKLFWQFFLQFLY